MRRPRRLPPRVVFGPRSADESGRHVRLRPTRLRPPVQLVGYLVLPIFSFDSVNWRSTRRAGFYFFFLLPNRSFHGERRVRDSAVRKMNSFLCVFNILFLDLFFFLSLEELVRDGENGLTFTTSSQLADHLLTWFADSDTGTGEDLVISFDFQDHLY